jgi:hypothetical protein
VHGNNEVWRWDNANRGGSRIAGTKDAKRVRNDVAEIINFKFVQAVKQTTSNMA